LSERLATQVLLANSIASAMSSSKREPRIEYGPRGEDIGYSLNGRTVWLSFTYLKGPRIYPDSITKWAETGESLSIDEKRTVLKHAISFVSKNEVKPIITINCDDPCREIWEDVCRSEQASINRIEYTSNAEQENFEREMYLRILRAGKNLVINNREMRTEDDLNDFFRRRSSSQ
jgi:hypothetical protein